MGVKPTRIGLFGGTFDPFHNGHLSVIRAAQASGLVDEILVIPAPNPRLRDSPVAAVAERLHMAELGVEGMKHVSVSDVDVRRGGETRTVDTIKDVLKMRGGKVECGLILGIDSASKMGAWVALDEILRLAKVIVVARPGAEGEVLDWEKRFGVKAARLQGEMVDVSANHIRRVVCKGGSATELLPAKVWDYIKARKLYTREAKN